MKKLIMVVLACYALNAKSQVDQSKNFLYLYSDSVIYAKKILMRPDFSGYWQLRADSRRVPMQQVKFFSNEEGFFGNTRKLTADGSPAFSERIIEGKINLFQEITFDPLIYDRRYRFRNRKQQTVDARMYYNKGFDDLKKVNYNNLKKDMANDQSSMDLLNAYRRSSVASKALYTAAGASIVAGLVSFLIAGNNNLKSSKDDFDRFKSGSSIKNPNFTPSFVLLGIGAGLAIGGVSINLSSSRRLEAAVDNYNR